MPGENDLSEYELLRLENIRRNAEFLANLGVTPLSATLPTKPAASTAASATIKKKRDTESRKRKSDAEEGGLERRRSRRLIGIAATEVAAAITTHEEPEVAEFSYDIIPLESDQLDDHEFQAFVILRKWRLQLCRRLDIEPYKIFQNRTFCELIRQRRNNPRWATMNNKLPAATEASSAGTGNEDTAEGSASNSLNRVDGQQDTSRDTEKLVPDAVGAKAAGTSAAEEGDGNTTNTVKIEKDSEQHKLEQKKKEEKQDRKALSARMETPSSCVEYDESIAADLIDCWGIGPSKVTGGGYAWQVLHVLNGADVCDLLTQSRQQQQEEEEKEEEESGVAQPVPESAVANN